MLVEATPIAAPAMNRAIPARTQGRRPIRSEIGPTTSWVTATAAR